MDVARQARDDGKAIYYRERAIKYRQDAEDARTRGNERAARRLNRLAAQDEDYSDRLCGRS